MLSKKDIVSFNQEVGEQGLLRNGSSLDYALSITKTKKWLYELSYLTRSLLVDHVFTDGNKRTCFLIIIYYAQYHNKDIDKEKLVKLIHKIAKENITNPIKISRLLYYAIRKKD